MRFLELADVILPTSDRYAKSSLFLREFLDKCVTVPLGVDVSRFRLVEAGKSLGGRTDVSTVEQAERLRSEHGDRIVLFVGLLRYYKGLTYLIEAMEAVDGKLLIVGDGPMRSELEALVRKRRLLDKVVFVGKVPEDWLPAYFHCSDVFCLPAIFRSEAFGVCQLEAMACGKPVVSTDLDSGVPFVNQDGVTGLVVPPRDPRALAGAIGALLTDRRRAVSMGEAGKRRVEREFTVRRMAESVLSVYEDLVGVSR